MNKKKSSISVKPQQTEAVNRHSRARRRLLQSLGAGAVINVKQLPELWSRPLLDSTMLPAHAEISAAATLSCELTDVDADPTAASPLRASPGSVNEPFNPSLTGGMLGTLFGWGSEISTGGGTVTFDIDTEATINPPSAGPVTLVVGGTIMNTLDVEAGSGNQVVAPNTLGVVDFAPVLLQVTNPTPGAAFSQTVDFTFSAAGQQCVISVAFTENIPGP